MAQCKDCIHNGLCKIYSDFIRNHDCELFVGKADVVPKSEVEALLKENERWMMEYADYRAEVNSIIEKAKQEVAREIFEELDERFVWTDGDYYMSFPYFVYAELKKKYTESEGEHGRDSNIQPSS